MADSVPSQSLRGSSFYWEATAEREDYAYICNVLLFVGLAVITG